MQYRPRVVWVLTDQNFRKLHTKLKLFFKSPLTFNAMTDFFLLREINQGFNKG